MLRIDQLSYWERTTYFEGQDVVIVGAGIVGLTTAIAIKNKYPLWKILILEKGYLPSGASTKNAGFAGDGVRKLTKLLSATGPMLSQSTNADKQTTKYRDDLSNLETRMTNLLSRYTKQFAAMDSLVGNVNSQKTSLKSSFDGMMASYTNK